MNAAPNPGEVLTEMGEHLDELEELLPRLRARLSDRPSAPSSRSGERPSLAALFTAATSAPAQFANAATGYRRR